MTHYLVITQWSCRDNGRRLTFYRSHVRIAESVKDARAQERAHNATRTDMRDEGWRSKVVHVVEQSNMSIELSPDVLDLLRDESNRNEEWRKADLSDMVNGIVRRMLDPNESEEMYERWRKNTPTVQVDPVTVRRTRNDFESMPSVEEAMKGIKS
jgi:hypothetical protein